MFGYQMPNLALLLMLLMATGYILMQDGHGFLISPGDPRFHYGTWYTDAIYGPIWVPGYQWGPGWVAWRGSPNYYGWTSIGPGVSYEMAYSNGYNVPYNQWTFVSCNYYGYPNSYNYYETPSNNVTIINNTTVINNSYTDKTSNVTYN